MIRLLFKYIFLISIFLPFISVEAKYVVEDDSIVSNSTSKNEILRYTTIKLRKKQIADTLFEVAKYEQALKFYTKAYNRGNTSESVKNRIELCNKLIDSLYYTDPKNVVYDSIGIVNKIKLWLADDNYSKQRYAKAIIWYEKVIQNYDSIYYITSRIADSYRKYNKFYKAEYWYGYIINKEEYEPIDIYYYAEALKNNMKYDEASRWLAKYNQLVKDDILVIDQLENPEYIDEILSDSSRFMIEELNINSIKSDFGIAYYKNEIVFSSSRKGSIINSTYGWNAEPFLDLYVAKKSEDGTLYNVEKFAKEINTKFHEGPVCFTDSFKTMYFTRNHFPRRSTDGERVNRLKILKSTYSFGKWDRPVDLKFNNPEYSCGHPSISTDGKTIYFASDMPGGYGGIDIYKSTLINGEWSEPQNLGSNINTPKNEMFPFIHTDGTLYFSSDGHKGLGGLDIFYALPKRDKFYQPQIFGYPVNSSKDDFALVLGNSRFSGYLSSNRSKNEVDNLYKVVILPLPPIANDDHFSTQYNTFSLLFNPLDNDVYGDCKYIYVSEIDTISSHGAKVDLKSSFGMVTYYPKKGFSGIDTIMYTICDTLSFKQNCAEGQILIEIYKNPLVLIGKAVRKKTWEALDNVEVVITNKQTNISEKYLTGSDGIFAFIVDRENDYEISCSKLDFETVIDQISTKNIETDTIKITEPLTMFPYAMEGIVVYSDDNTPVKDVRITLKNNDNEIIKTLYTKEDGKFYFPLESNSSYIVKLEKGELLTRTRFITTQDVKPGVIKMKELVEMLKMEVGATLEVEILFDLGKWDIRPDAAKILDEDVIQFMKDNPQVNFEFGAHTDARGSAQSNQSLSQKRAESAVNYMIQKGIKNKRISAKGYGESKLKNRCKDGVECTEEEHQSNRRIEIKVVGY